MKVNSIITSMLHTELSSLGIAAKEDIVERDRILLTWVNQGLRDINIKLGGLVQKEHIYILVTDSIDAGLTYLLPNDFLELIGAYDEAGQPLSVNNRRDKLSIYRDSPKTILIPYSNLGDKVSIIYSAKLDDVLTMEDELPINDQYEGLLTNFIAAKAFTTLESQDKLANNKYEALYIRAINELINSGMYNKDAIDEYTHFERGGWK